MWCHNPNTIGKSIKQQRAHIGSSLDCHSLYVVVVVLAADNHWLRAIFEVQNGASPLGSRVCCGGVNDHKLVGNLVVNYRRLDIRATAVLGRAIALWVQNCKLARACCKVVNDHICYGNLILRCLGERYADCIANAVGKQCANAHSTLYATLNAISSLCYAKVNRVVHTLCLHSLGKQSVGVHHHAGVG